MERVNKKSCFRFEMVPLKLKFEDLFLIINFWIQKKDWKSVITENLKMFGKQLLGQK